MAIPRLQSGVSVAKEITERWIAKHPRNDDGDIELAAFGTLVDAINDVFNAHTCEVLEAAAKMTADLWKRDDNNLSPAVLMIVAHEIRKLKEK